MLYRKYRPKIFSEIFGQEHIVKTLIGALSSKRIGHAYLFTGPRGTGKTTMARLFAKALNCKNPQKNGDADDKCDNCKLVNEGRFLDLIEIDAASNRGIDEIRSVKDTAIVSSSMGGYKVFIVDEVHMLTAHAFNALLKILEEPPAHVIFILATTEPHKVLPTVLSRVQRFDFRKLTITEIFNKLKNISKSEKLSIDDEALMAVAMASDGALRDAEVSLSKIIAWSELGQKITVSDANAILGLISYKYYPEFLNFIITKDSVSALDFIQKLSNDGIDWDSFTLGFIEYLRKILMFKISPAILASAGDSLANHDLELINKLGVSLNNQIISKIIIDFISAKDLIKNSPLPQLPIELAVLELCTK